ncbi:hypothetical protein H696_03228 [Fonticula alba]|uniref:Protein kinase domain-containing protein n=1 Tax=Fonticula alba TaxID=691883 RepID=A0A058Z775_FONAL|nr:hypothetical protein H696_03228 [Fonticula alba]KCV69783.1 hypothetical protein H696_03228 [Fonticula alba]|eukprot:XP_009495389.1 hypothetical protein H696_03228 [Fonticula alba]
MTVRYAAPEVIGAFQRGISLDRAAFLPADIFSAAVMLLECLTRAVPWPNMDMQGIVSAVQAGQRPGADALPVAVQDLAGQRPGADALPVAVQDLVRAAWQADPAMRPHAATLRQQCAALFVAVGGLGQ